MKLFLRNTMLTAVFMFPFSSMAQQGPTSMQCTAYANNKVVARYNCLAGRDASGKINFIQWEDGTASTGLGGWKQAGAKCFAAEESPSWKICVN